MNKNTMNKNSGISKMMNKCRMPAEKRIGKIRKSRNSILYSFMIFILLFSVFAFAGFYSMLNSEKQGTLGTVVSKTSYVEDDIAGNAFLDLTKMGIYNISRSSNMVIVFDQLLMNYTARDYPLVFRDYRDFIEKNYSSMNNLNITLNAFNENLTIMPYNTTVVIGQQNAYFYTMPNAVNYIQSISVTIKAYAVHEGTCDGPGADAGQTPITITFIDSGGWSCAKTVELNPAENNDKPPDNTQFMQLFGGGVTTEVKYGLINGKNGVLQITGKRLLMNVSEIKLTYSLPSGNVVVYDGAMRITDAVSNVTKSTDIVVAQE